MESKKRARHSKTGYFSRSLSSLRIQSHLRDRYWRVATFSDYRVLNTSFTPVLHVVLDASVAQFDSLVCQHHTTCQLMHDFAACRTEFASLNVPNARPFCKFLVKSIRDRQILSFNSKEPLLHLIVQMHRYMIVFVC